MTDTELQNLMGQHGWYSTGIPGRRLRCEIQDGDVWGIVDTMAGGWAVTAITDAGRVQMVRVPAASVLDAWVAARDAVRGLPEVQR